MRRIKNLILPLILFLAFMIRVGGISSYPVGFTQDEAALGYDAYSLLETGKDQWGNSWPLVLRSFGDFKMPLYSYLAIPSIGIFGLNEFATRLPSAIIGTLAVLATYLLVKRLGGYGLSVTGLTIKTRNALTLNEGTAVTAALLLAISPWHISLSRGAFEANLTTFFIPLGIWLYFLGIEKPKYLIFSALAFGLNLFSYHSARIFTLLILPILILLTFKEIKKLIRENLEKLLPSIFIFGGFVIMLLYSLSLGAGRRASDVTIFNPTDKWAAVSDRRYEAILQGLPTEGARIFSNKITYLFHRFTSNYLSYLSPNFLFTEGVSEWSYGMIPGRGALYTLEVIPILAGFVFYLRDKKQENIKILLLWLLLAPIPAALSKGSGGSGTRAATLMPAIQILSAYGVISILSWVKVRFSLTMRNLGLLLVLGLYIISLIFFFEDYRYHAKLRGAKAMQYGMRETMEFIGSVEDNYSEILLSRSLSVPNIWVQFYLKVDPVQVQEATKQWVAYEKQGYVSIDQMSQYSLGKYTFSGIDKEGLAKEKRVLVVGKPDEFKASQEVLKAIYYPDKIPAYVIVDSKNM
jgi:4-amino-4-deoxy-L-arabinose transferase-like glycosyltransferase